MTPKTKQPKKEKVWLKKWDRIEIVWNDADVTDGALLSGGYIGSYPGCKRRTLGYFLDQQKGRIFIAETDDRRAICHVEGAVSDCERITSVPTAMIEELILLGDTEVG